MKDFSTHYIGQIELENKFPTPEMLEKQQQPLILIARNSFHRNFSLWNPCNVFKKKFYPVWGQ